MTMSRDEEEKIPDLQRKTLEKTLGAASSVSRE
jgi:hypothetical protein